MEEGKNPEVQTGGDDVAPAENKGIDSPTDDSTTKDDALRVAINESLGKDFKSTEDIVKSMSEADKKISQQGNTIKEMQEQLDKLSGQPEDEPEGNKPEVDKSPDLSKNISSLEDRLNQAEFYKDNPQYDKPEIREVLGRNPAETIKNESIKSVIDGKVESDKIEQSKSVLQSNPRLGSATDKVTKARESYREAVKAAQEGDIASSTVKQSEAGLSATEAVIDAYELGS